MKLYVKRDQYGTAIKSQIIIDSMPELTTIRLALDAKISYCQEWLEKSTHPEEIEFWRTELELYVKTYKEVDVANSLEWEVK